MSVTDELLANNARYAETFSGPLPLPPSRGVAVVACMDARLDVYRVLGLNEGDYGVLAPLRRAGAPFALTPTELARHRMMTSGGTTAALDRLERKGLVERAPNPADRRGSLMRLTDAGLEIVDAAMSEHVRTEEQLVASLSVKERDQLASLLRKLLGALDAG